MPSTARTCADGADELDWAENLGMSVHDPRCCYCDRPVSFLLVRSTGGLCESCWTRADE